jgi:hypothetical protein
LEVERGLDAWPVGGRDSVFCRVRWAGLLLRTDYVGIYVLDQQRRQGWVGWNPISEICDGDVGHPGTSISAEHPACFGDYQTLRSTKGSRSLFQHGISYGARHTAWLPLGPFQLHGLPLRLTFNSPASQVFYLYYSTKVLVI